MSKLICPNCGAATSFSPDQIIGEGILLGRSTETDTEWGRVQISAITTHEYDEDAYAILICQACNEYFVAKREAYGDEWLAVYPIPHKPVAQEIPEPIRGQFEEAQLCFAIEAYIACLLVCRTALIAIQREQGVSNLKELKDKGIISDLLYKQANQVRLWANMVGHEDIPEAISGEDCEQLLVYLEALLTSVYVEPKRLSELTQKFEKLKIKD